MLLPSIAAAAQECAAGITTCEAAPWRYTHDRAYRAFPAAALSPGASTEARAARKRLGRQRRATVACCAGDLPGARAAGEDAAQFRTWPAHPQMGWRQWALRRLAARAATFGVVRGLGGPQYARRKLQQKRVGCALDALSIAGSGRTAASLTAKAIKPAGRCPAQRSIGGHQVGLLLPRATA